MLTCHQVGLDRQSHHAHKDVAAKGAILGPDPSQLWVDIKKISFKRSRRQQLRRAYMIKHCECNEQVRERVCNDPGLVGRSQVVRKVIHLAYMMVLPFRR